MLTPVSEPSPIESVALELAKEPSRTDFLTDLFQAVVITVIPAVILGLSCDAHIFEDERIMELFFDL